MDQSGGLTDRFRGPNEVTSVGPNGPVGVTAVVLPLGRFGCWHRRDPLGAAITNGYRARVDCAARWPMLPAHQRPDGKAHGRETHCRLHDLHDLHNLHVIIARLS